jgi:hypothetical protein
MDMSSWVAPSVAAEIWGISVAQVLDRIAQGSLPSMVDGQFLFVDIAFDGFACSGARPAPSQNDSIITPEELAALTYLPLEEIAASPEPQNEKDEGSPQIPETVRPSDTDDEHLPLGEEEPSTRDIRQWRTARSQTSRLRRPPMLRAAA